MSKKEYASRAKLEDQPPLPDGVPATAPKANALTKLPSYICSLHPRTSGVIPPEFAKAVQELSSVLKMPVWLIVQTGGTGSYNQLTAKLWRSLLLKKKEIIEGQRIVLLIHSPGGYAKAAYQIATFFRRHCGGFIAAVPRYAKSAATLLALGADEILLGKYAELGPLDAQVLDPDREERYSALDEVQILERMHAFALSAIDRSMFLLAGRTKKKIDKLLPSTLDFISNMMRPLLEGIDTVHYTQMSRLLKVAEEYATRLLLPRHQSKEGAQEIARHLVESYPDHEFVIDIDEARTLGLHLGEVNSQVHAIFDRMLPYHEFCT